MSLLVTIVSDLVALYQISTITRNEKKKIKPAKYYKLL